MSGDGETTAASGEDLGLITEGTLFIGLDTPYPPFAEGQPPDATGYDVEVLNAIGENLGLEVEYQDTGFQTIFRDVAAGQFDTAGAASTITAGRENVVDFTDPYYLSSTALAGGGGLGHRLGRRPRRRHRRHPGRDHPGGVRQRGDRRLRGARLSRGHERDHGAADRPGGRGADRPGGRRGRGREAGRHGDRRGDPRRGPVRVRGRARQRRPARGDERSAGDDQGGRHDGGAVRHVLRRRAARPRCSRARTSSSPTTSGKADSSRGKGRRRRPFPLGKAVSLAPIPSGGEAWTSSSTTTSTSASWATSSAASSTGSG